MSYTTVTKVREASGFVGNTNITDAFISQQIMRADNKVNSKIGDVYALPLPKYFTQTITFSGTGSASANMTITVDSKNYVIAVSLNLTASQAADLFRTAANVTTNTNFVTDGLGGGAAVTIYNKDQTGDYLDVTVTSTDPQTVSGITATCGTVTEIAVPLIEYISTEISTALLLTVEYGAETQDSDKNGFKRLALCDSILNSIADKKEKIYDFNSVELPASTTKQIVFSPNDTTEDDDDEPTAFKFTMNKTF